MAREAETGFAHVEFSAPSMMCDGCAEKIRNTVLALPGVRSVKTKLWRKRVRVRYEASTIQKDQIKHALSAAGFVATEV